MEAENSLSIAKKDLNAAKVKADEIKQQSLILSEQAYKTILESAENDIRLLKVINLTSIQSVEEQSIGEVVLMLVYIYFSIMYVYVQKLYIT